MFVKLFVVGFFVAMWGCAFDMLGLENAALAFTGIGIGASFAAVLAWLVKLAAHAVPLTEWEIRRFERDFQRQLERELQAKRARGARFWAGRNAAVDVPARQGSETLH